MIYQLFILFFIYSFFGWIAEVIYCSVPAKKFENRGFLYMPICPIYGFGAIFIILLLLPFKKYWFVVLFLGILITSALEYFTSFVMEKFFKIRWWDYSHKRFNINGRVCLLNSSLFGLLSLLLVYVIHPFFIKIFDYINSPTTIIISSILLVLLIADTIASTIAVGKFNGLIERIKKAKDQIFEDYEKELKKYFYIFLKFPRIRSIKDYQFFEKIKEYILNKYNSIKNKFIKK